MESHAGFPFSKIDLNIPKLSIIIPCYNEVGNIPSLFQKLRTFQNRDIEIILVNNGSTDETSAVLSKELDDKSSIIKSVSIKENIGYGHGIMTGVRFSQGQIISWTHADLQTDPLDVVNAFSTYINNPDYKKCILKGRRIGRNLFDVFFTFWMGVLSTILMRVKLTDINAQPKMFHRSFLENMKDVPNDFSLDLYLLYQARINNYSVIEYPVQFSKRIYGESKGGGTLKGKWKLIKRTWTYMIKLRKKIKEQHGNNNT